MNRTVNKINSFDSLIIIMVSLLMSGCIGEKQSQDGQANISDNERLGVSSGVAELARQDAIIRFNLSEDSVKIDTVIPVEWTDTSLGYPEPGKELGIDYTLETIRGYTIIITANGKLYEYHSDYKRIVPPKGPTENLILLVNETKQNDNQ